MNKADSPKGDSYTHFVEQKGGRERRRKGGEEGRTNPNLFGGLPRGDMSRTRRSGTW